MTRRGMSALAGGLLGILVTASLLVAPGQAAVPSTYRSEVMTDSPLGYWRLGELSGATAADESANNDVGTYQNGVTLGMSGAIPSEPDKAARFDGIDDGVSMGDPSSGALDAGTANFTLETWIKTSVNNDQVVAAKQGSSGPYWQVTVTDDTGAVGYVRAKVNDGVVSRQVYGPAVRVDDGQWHHIVVLFARATGITIYVDKANVRQTAGSASASISNSAPLIVGGPVQWYPGFKGDIDEVVLYNGLLSPVRIQSHYDAATAPGDGTAPIVSLVTPPQNSLSNDPSPIFTGSAGTTPGDQTTVTVMVYGGSSVGGTPLETLGATPDADGAWSVRASPALPTGTYTAQAQQSDAAGNVGSSSPRTFSVDTTPPAVTLGTPAGGSSTTDTSPTFAGSAGTSPGDLATVTVNVYSGSSAGGTPLQTPSATPDASGAWSVRASPALAAGTYTAQAQQSDAAGNIGRSSAAVFTLTAAPSPPPPPPPPSYRSEVMTDGPRGYWRLGETSGSTAVDQAQGNNPGGYQNGVALGAPGAIPGDIDKAARFDGIDDAVNMGDPASGALDFGTGNFTVETWIRTSVNNEQVIASKQGYSGPYWQVTVTDDYGATGRVRTRIYDGSTTRQAYGPLVAVDDGQWHHVVVAFARATGTTIYVDKAARQTTGAATGTVSNTARLLIGGRTVDSFPSFNGDIDEVAVYPMLLSASRDQAHYDRAVGADTTPPAPSVSGPAQGSFSSDSSPTFYGSAGMAVGDSSTIRVKIYSGSVAAGTPAQTIGTVRDHTGAWAADGSPALTSGTYTAQAEQFDGAGNTGLSAPVTFNVQTSSPPTADPTLLAAGDIADCTPGAETTAKLLDGLAGTIATIGDNAYENGTDAEFANCYAPTWGRHKARTRPAAGDHEYGTAGASGYFKYFGAAAGDPAKGYYSYDLGTWHVVTLNPNCGEIGGCQAGSAQEQWLRSDLSAHPAACTLSVVGSPLFSSGSKVGNNVGMRPLWQALYDYGADVALAGDDHDYERFAPQSPAGNLDLAGGISEFVLGTGGRAQYPLANGTLRGNSQVRNDNTFGVMKFTLHPGGYDWQFVPQAGKAFTDSGSRSCH